MAEKSTRRAPRKATAGKAAIDANGQYRIRVKAPCVAAGARFVPRRGMDYVVKGGVLAELGDNVEVISRVK